MSPTQENILQRAMSRADRICARLEAVSGRYANVRLAIVVIAFVGTAAAFFFGGVLAGSVTLAAAVIAFAVVVSLHRRIDRRLRECRVWLAIQRESLARMTLDWAGIPPTGVTAPETHPFAADLDLPLIHRLISTATTQQASDRLYGWLLTIDPDLPAILRRQGLVRELAPLTRFRTRLTLYGRLHAESLGALTSGDRVLAWLRGRQAPPRFGVWVAAALIAALVAQTLIVLGLSGTLAGAGAWRIALLIYVAIFLMARRQAGDLFREALELREMLETLGHVTTFLERYRFAPGSGLEALTALIRAAKPSRALARIGWLASGASLQGNFLLWFAVNLIFPFDLLVAWGLYRVKAALLAKLPAWLETWYELEALSALATFAYLNPTYTFPHLREGDRDNVAVIRAEGLGHPLIPAPVKVANDMEIADPGTVWIITGSNMSGKSTFLRAVGVNLCLAQAGGPVDARLFEARPLRLFSSMRINDSIPEGVSYFYAEVKRLKALLDAVRADHPTPVCFLIDEIFRGTNNRERLTGSRAYVRALIGSESVGLIATHDLELAHLADSAPALHNYHFQEDIEDGRLMFRYKLLEGPSTSTNALLIMRNEGLPIE